MALQNARPPIRDIREPTQHPLEPVRVAGQTIHLSVLIRRDAHGVWRGRLLFFDALNPSRELSTAEIFCGDSEEELWLAVRHLRDHHIRDLHRSLDAANT